MGGDQLRHPVAGDIVVVKVADHYHVSRVTERTPWTSIDAIDSESDALTLACELVSSSQRVFLYRSGSLPEHVLVDCANPYWEHR